MRRVVLIRRCPHVAPHLAETLITSTVSGTLKASPMADVAIVPERAVPSGSALSSSPSEAYVNSSPR